MGWSVTEVGQVRYCERVGQRRRQRGLEECKTKGKWTDQLGDLGSSDVSGILDCDCDGVKHVVQRSLAVERLGGELDVARVVGRGGRDAGVRVLKGRVRQTEAEGEARGTVLGVKPLSDASEITKTVSMGRTGGRRKKGEVAPCSR